MTAERGKKEETPKPPYRHHPMPYAKYTIIEDAQGNRLLLTYGQVHELRGRYQRDLRGDFIRRKKLQYKEYTIVGNTDPRGYGTTGSKEVLLSSTEMQKADALCDHLVNNPPFFWQRYDFAGILKRKKREGEFTTPYDPADQGNL